MIFDFFKLGWNNLKRRKVRSWLTMIGIFIGIMAVIALFSLGQGLKTAVNSQFGISSTEIITVKAGGISMAGPPGTGVTKPLTTKDLDAISKLKNVESAIRRNMPNGKIEFNNKVFFGIIGSVGNSENRKLLYDQLELETERGRLLKDGDSNKVMLGNNFYTEKKRFGKKIDVGDKILIQNKSFSVVGIVRKKGSFLFDNAIYMNEEPLKELMNFGDKVDLIVVKVKNKNLMEKTKEDIEKLLRKRRKVKKGEEDFEVSTPESMLSTVNQILSGVQLFIVIIALISIIVGAIGIVNTMTTSVLERKKEIGIMKSIGAKNSQIFLMFFIESGLLGFIGGIMGVISGLIIGDIGINAINNFIGATTKPDINIILILTTIIGSFLIGSISGILPAMNAAKLNPVEALRS